MTYEEKLFQVLEISPTKDRKEIKRAYAKMIRKVHPEDDPEQWAVVHDAYEELLRLCPGESTGRTVSAVSRNAAETLNMPGNPVFTQRPIIETERPDPYSEFVTPKKSEKPAAPPRVPENPNLSPKPIIETERPDPYAKYKTPSVGHFSENESGSENESESEENELNKALENMVNQAMIEGPAYHVSGEMWNLMKSLPSLHDSLYGKMTIHHNILWKIRYHQDYGKAMGNLEFLDELSLILKACAITGSDADALLDDIANQEIFGNKTVNYTDLRTLLQEKKEEYAAISQSRLAKLTRDGGFWTTALRGDYYLLDFKRAGAKCTADVTTKKYLGNHIFYYTGEITIKGRTYPVFCYQKQKNEALYLHSLQSNKFDSPEQCIGAIQTIRDFFEEYYSKRKVLFFLRSLLIGLLNLLPLAAVGFILWLYVFTDAGPAAFSGLALLALAILILVVIRSRLIGGPFEPSNSAFKKNQ